LTLDTGVCAADAAPWRQMLSKRRRLKAQRTRRRALLPAKDLIERKHPTIDFWRIILPSYPVTRFWHIVVEHENQSIGISCRKSGVNARSPATRTVLRSLISDDELPTSMRTSQGEGRKHKAWPRVIAMPARPPIAPAVSA
jgi:hypothetical protein